MIRNAILVLVALSLPATHAQTIRPAGTDDTFDVATWNIEFFGADTNSNGPPVQGQLDNVVEVISQADIDMWAIQEVAALGDTLEPETWGELLDLIGDQDCALALEDEYCGILGPTPSFGNFRVAAIYRKAVFSAVEVVDDPAYTNIVQGSVFGGRGALVLRATLAPDQGGGEVYFFIIHAASFATEEAHDVRVKGALRLKEHTDALVDQGESVILLGDFNDNLVDARWQGCPTGDTECDPDDPPIVPSPYAIFVDDSDRYGAATLGLEEDNVPTFCHRGSPLIPCEGILTIDHIVYTPDELSLVRTRRYESVLNTLEDYVATTSDHAPVYARFDLTTEPRVGARRSASAMSLRAGGARLLPPSPHPFTGATDLRFVLDAPSNVRLDVFDALGRAVLHVEELFDAGSHSVGLDGGKMAPGAYILRLTVGSAAQSAVIVRAG